MLSVANRNIMSSVVKTSVFILRAIMVSVKIHSIVKAKCCYAASIILSVI